MTIAKALLCLTLIFTAEVALAESPSEVDRLAIRLSDYLSQNKISVDKDITQTEVKGDGRSNIKLMIPKFLLCTIAVFASDEEARREDTVLQNKLQSSPLGPQLFVSARNENLLLLIVPLTDQQADEAKSIKDIFMKFSARSPGAIGNNERQAAR